MDVVIRVDASVEIGSGHVMRCLTLAEELKKYDVTTVFVTRAHLGNLDEIIKSKGFSVLSLPRSPIELSQKKSTGYEQNLGVKQEVDAIETIQAIGGNTPDWIIVDHYALSYGWEQSLRLYTDKIMVLDDLSNRRHECDILLDQTFGKHKSAYTKLVPNHCRLLMGSRYALLRSVFGKLRLQALKRRDQDQQVERILISMGSMDETKVTPRVLESLLHIDFNISPTVDIVLSSNAPHLNALREFVNSYPLNVNILLDVTNMAELMLKSDLAIGSGGTTSWERCCLGLPAVLIVLAENQAVIGENLQKAGATITLQDDTDLVINIKNSVEKFIQSQQQYLKVSNSAAAICDGAGATKVVQEILK
jgi:UDP-2,4-diacetamido-2,4,6-trideoxy-beta-L-altropyranose hydrolase